MRPPTSTADEPALWMSSAEVQRTIEAVWRIESARLIGGLARYVRDLGLAEDLAQDALVAALEQWPQSGVPDNPGAWLMGTAKHRAIDAMRRSADGRAKTRPARARARARPCRGRPRPRSLESTTTIGDDLLTLLFATCHPRPLDRGPGGAHAAAVRRPDDGRDRACVPGPRVDDRAADRARQADAGRGPRADRDPGGRRARPSGSGRCSR